MTFRIVFCAAMFTLLSAVVASDTPPDGWTTAAPRDEISPRFSYEASGGRNGAGRFVIQADARDGQQGCWTKSVPVQGGKFYRAVAFRRSENVPLARRSLVVRVLWRDDAGKAVPGDEPLVEGF